MFWKIVLIVFACFGGLSLIHILLRLHFKNHHGDILKDVFDGEEEDSDFHPRKSVGRTDDGDENSILLPVECEEDPDAFERGRRAELECRREESELIEQELQHLEEKRCLLQEMRRELDKKTEQLEEENRYLGYQLQRLAEKRRQAEETYPIPLLPSGLPMNGKNAYSALYAPASVEIMRWFKIQVHLYPMEDAGLAREKARAMDGDSEMMVCNPLALKLNLGTRVKVDLTMFDVGVLVQKSTRFLVWNGELTSTVFLAKVTDTSLTSIAGEVTLSVEDIPVGVLSFVMDVSSSPVSIERNKLGFGRLYKRAFISYSHFDFQTAATVAAILRAQEIPFFWDKKSLDPGAEFNDVIKKNIDESDVFFLLWSKNAAESDYVNKEYHHALQRVELQKRSGAATLDIKTFSIEPFAEPPSDLGHYNFYRIQFGF